MQFEPCWLGIKPFWDASGFNRSGTIGEISGHRLLAVWTAASARGLHAASCTTWRNRNIAVENESSELCAERLQAEVALTHLERALEVVDSIELPLQIGARIQQSIDMLLPWTSQRIGSDH